MAKNKSIQNIYVGRREPEDKLIENNWTQLDPQKTKISRKTILVFGGNTTNSPEEANGYAKSFESLLLPSIRNNTDILSFFYRTEIVKSEGLPISQEYVDETHELFNSVFKPLIYDKTTGKMKELQGIEKAFNKMVFVGHCGGCNIINLIIDDYYQELQKKYPPSTAKTLIHKIQYVGYTPYEYPQHHISSLFISPSADPNNNWLGIIDNINESKIDVDYPKGICKKLTKEKNRDCPGVVLADAFCESRAVAIKQGKTTYLIPDRMNPALRIGDHSIACITKQKFLNNDSYYSENAVLMHNIAKLYLNQFASDSPFNDKGMFSKTTSLLEQSAPNFESTSSQQEL